mmetsp:Transcript_14297/g.31052  ORF Transcript_14297/g.31052 Transcript_14297/m.31052 type:complete len:127 (+) Transcript_14297:323-703(+)
MTDSDPEPLSNPNPQKNRMEVLENRDLGSCMAKLNIKSNEECVNILYLPESTFRVHPATRCSSSIEGHKEAILHVSFSPCSKYLASGSGDNTCRLNSMTTECVMQTFQASAWVMVTSFTLDSKRLL